MVNCSCQKELGFIITIICLIYIQTIHAQGTEQHCNITSLNQCGPHESCEQIDSTNSTGLCKCISRYHRLVPDNQCVEINPTTPRSDMPVTAQPFDSNTLPEHHRLLAGVLIPLFLTVTVLLGLVWAAVRYKWVQKLRAMRQRRYDEVQFGQEEDDPPLA